MDHEPSGRVRTGLTARHSPVTNCKDFFNIYINNSYMKKYMPITWAPTNSKNRTQLTVKGYSTFTHKRSVGRFQVLQMLFQLTTQSRQIYRTTTSAPTVMFTHLFFFLQLWSTQKLLIVFILRGYNYIKPARRGSMPKGHNPRVGRCQKCTCLKTRPTLINLN